MLAMQYSIPLPHNVGAEYIRERVSSRRALFDNHPGLVHKSFVYSETDHIYAPFYIWKDAGEVHQFLLDLFQGVVDTFSRQRVRSWIVLSMQYGDKTIKPAYARREIDLIAPEDNLKDYVSHERQAQAALLTNPNLYMHVFALDADRWELMRFSLWRDKKTAPASATDCYQSYDVLHVSEPI